MPITTAPTPRLPSRRRSLALRCWWGGGLFRYPMEVDIKISDLRI